MSLSKKGKEEWNFNYKEVEELVELKPKNSDEVDEILNKALKLKGLSKIEAAKLLNISEKKDLQKLLETSRIVKEKIYGKRMVIFAPLYIANLCSNDCMYCAFRKSNTQLKRAVLNQEEIKEETLALLKDGHKRVLMLTGESKSNDLNYFIESINTVYSVNYYGHTIRRINVEIAPLTTEEFSRLKAAKIGTYACFQETYHPELYKKYHPSGPKSDYQYRLNVMHRAMAGGIDDVGIGALFGLADYRFEVLSMLFHAESLEKEFGCGPHTISVPRIEPAEGTPFTENIPYKVSDDDFKKIIAILRITLPYTGIILSTRESEELRNELFQYGVSQISAGSRTNPGAYSKEAYSGASKKAYSKKEDKNEEKQEEKQNEEKQKDQSMAGSQFSLGDHRSLSEVIETLVEKEFIPSFCTGCYRKGRVGNDFMDLAKPGLIQHYCMPNGLFTFQEYLEDFANEKLKERGTKLINKMIEEIPNQKLKELTKKNIEKIRNGEKDIYI